MADVLRAWRPERHRRHVRSAQPAIRQVLVTISTGLQWLESRPGGRVVVATHTKQLQRQLASEIERLATGSLSWLRPAAPAAREVRRFGSACGRWYVPSRTAPRRWTREAPRHPANLICRREKIASGPLAFVFLRTCAQTCTTSPTSRSAYSVDPMDVPPFFETYTNSTLWPAGSSFSPQAGPNVFQQPPPATQGAGGQGGAAPAAGRAPAPAQGTPGAQWAGPTLFPERPPRHPHRVRARGSTAPPLHRAPNHALLLAHLEHDR